jgi:hypothetical protein
VVLLPLPGLQLAQRHSEHQCHLLIGLGLLVLLPARLPPSPSPPPAAAAAAPGEVQQQGLHLAADQMS